MEKALFGTWNEDDNKVEPNTIGTYLKKMAREHMGKYAWISCRLDDLARYVNSLPTKLRLIDHSVWYSHVGWHRFVGRHIKRWKNFDLSVDNILLPRNVGGVDPRAALGTKQKILDEQDTILFQQIFEDADGVLIDVATGERFGKASAGTRFPELKKKEK